MSVSGAEVDEPGFDEIAKRYRRELHVHCYRMLGSFDEAEDHVQEVLLRAWQSWQRFEHRSGVRTWLYRIATNACLDTLRRNARRAAPAANASTGPQGMPWLQPYPDALLDEIAATSPDPEATAVGKETISLAFLAAIQLLPPRQRAVLILRDVLGFSAADVATLMESTVASANSALQRARATIHERWPGGRAEWAAATETTSDQRRLLDRFISAHEAADADALIAVLAEEVRLAIFPEVGEWNGKSTVASALRDGMTSLGRWRYLPTRANGQPAAAGYLLRAGDTAYRPYVLTVLAMDNGTLVDMAHFEAPQLFAAFGLPPVLAMTDR